MGSNYSLGLPRGFMAFEDLPARASQDLPMVSKIMPRFAQGVPGLFIDKGSQGPFETSHWAQAACQGLPRTFYDFPNPSKRLDLPLGSRCMPVLAKGVPQPPTTAPRLPRALQDFPIGSTCIARLANDVPGPSQGFQIPPRTFHDPSRTSTGLPRCSKDF